MKMSFKKIKFVTDSVADLPDEIVQKWQIEVVPCFVNYGGNSYADDGIELVREDYYNLLPSLNENPTTAAMSPDFARPYIDRAFEGADHLIVITTPAKLSGIHNALRLATSHLPSDQVNVIDSGQLSLGMAWQVINGADVAAETGDVDLTLKAIDQTRTHTQTFAAIKDLKFLQRSGRVGWAVARVGTLLDIKPVVQVIDGDVQPATRVRTFNKALDTMAQMIRDSAPIDKLGILHVNNSEGTESLKSRLEAELPFDTIIGTISPTLGTHTGPGAIGFAAVRKGWKDAITAGNAG